MKSIPLKLYTNYYSKPWGFLSLIKDDWESKNCQAVCWKYESLRAVCWENEKYFERYRADCWESEYYKAR